MICCSTNLTFTGKLCNNAIVFRYTGAAIEYNGIVTEYNGVVIECNAIAIK